MHMRYLREMREHCRVISRGIYTFVYMVKRKMTNTSNYKLCHVSCGVGNQVIVDACSEDLEWGQPLYILVLKSCATFGHFQKSSLTLEKQQEYSES